MSIVNEMIRNLFKKPSTSNFPFDRVGLNFPERLRGRHIINQEECIGCRRCSRVCPAYVIEMVPLTEKELVLRNDKKTVKPVINLGGCIFCGECEDVCPRDCIDLTNDFVMPNENPINFKVD